MTIEAMKRVVAASKLALEALEDISALQNHTNGNSSDADAAITALRQAIAEAQVRSTDEQLYEANQELIRLQYEVDAIPEIKEERDNLQVEVRILREKVKEQCRINDMEAKPVIDKSAAIRIATALGWTPPREPWVGLTDEERFKAEEGAWYMDELDTIIFSMNIEAKLKAKNSP